MLFLFVCTRFAFVFIMQSCFRHLIVSHPTFIIHALLYLGPWILGNTRLDCKFTSSICYLSTIMVSEAIVSRIVGLRCCEPHKQQTAAPPSFRIIAGGLGKNESSELAPTGRQTGNLLPSIHVWQEIRTLLRLHKQISNTQGDSLFWPYDNVMAVNQLLLACKRRLTDFLRHQEERNLTSLAYEDVERIQVDILIKK